MDNLLVKISIKYGLILSGVNLLILIINLFTINHNHYSSSWLTIFISIINLLIVCFIIVYAHNEFYLKNKRFISFKDALISGLIILLIPNIFTFIFFVSHEGSASISFIFESILFQILRDILLLLIIITFEALWKIYQKAGRKGWEAIIPIYNIYIFLKIVKKPAFWLILLMIPIVNIIFGIWVIHLLSERFGKKEDFTIGLILLPFIFYPLLGMSKANYIESI